MLLLWPRTGTSVCYPLYDYLLALILRIRCCREIQANDATLEGVMTGITRRNLLAFAATRPALSQARKLKIIVVGGHPDDPESGCGGAIARYADAGHDVVCLYLTRGEAGIRGKSADEAAAIRTRE